MALGHFVLGHITQVNIFWALRIYSDIFSYDSTKQKAVVQLFANLLKRREDTSSFNTGPSCYPERDIDSSHACFV